MEQNQLTEAISPIWRALDDKVLPWASEHSTRCVIATPTLRELRARGNMLPPEVTLSERKAQGRRVRLPKTQQRVGSEMATHQWPDDGLVSKRMMQLACIIRGRADFRGGDYILHVPAGTFIIIPPGVPHPDGSRSHLEGQGECDILWLMLWSGVLRCWICRSHDEEHGQHGDACFIREPQANVQYEALAVEAAGREPGFEAICRSLHLVLWTMLHRCMGRGQFFKNYRFNFGDETALVPADAPIPLAQDYIRSHLHTRLTLAEVAQRVYLSRTQFARRFHSETGQTFNAFVTDCRLEETKKLLAETQWPLTTIAEATGLTAAHLRTLFTRHYGQTPQEFRLSHRDKLL